FSDVNRDTVEVLARNGCEVVTPPEQACCGSLHAHNGEWELAQQLARKNIERFPPEQFDAIITNAAGCGSHLKHYAHLLEGDPGCLLQIINGAKRAGLKLRVVHPVTLLAEAYRNE